MLQKLAAGLQVNASALAGDYRVVCANNQDLSFVYYDNGISATPLKLYANGDAEVEGKLIVGNGSIQQVGSTMAFQYLGSTKFAVSQYQCNLSVNLIPSTDNTVNIGSSSNRIKSIHTIKLNPNASNYGLTLPDTTSFTADKVIATTDEFAFKRISLADFQALQRTDQLALCDEGVQIIGTLNVNVGGGDIKNPIFYPRRDYITYSQGLVIAGSTSQNPTIATYELVHAGTGITIKALLRGSDQNLNIVGNIGLYGDNAQNIGNSTHRIKDAYIAGNISDGTNSVTVADLAALITYAKAQGWIS